MDSTRIHGIFVIGEGINGCEPLAEQKVLRSSSLHIISPLRLVMPYKKDLRSLGREQNLA